MGSVLDLPSEAAKGFLNSSALLEEVLGSETRLQVMFMVLLGQGD